MVVLGADCGCGCGRGVSVSDLGSRVVVEKSWFRRSDWEGSRREVFRFEGLRSSGGGGEVCSLGLLLVLDRRLSQLRFSSCRLSCC